MDKFRVKFLCGGEVKRSETRSARGEYLPLSQEPLVPSPRLPSREAPCPRVKGTARRKKTGASANIRMKMEVFRRTCTVYHYLHGLHPTQPAGVVSLEYFIVIWRVIGYVTFAMTWSAFSNEWSHLLADVKHQTSAVALHTKHNYSPSSYNFVHWRKKNHHTVCLRGRNHITLLLKVCEYHASLAAAPAAMPHHSVHKKTFICCIWVSLRGK